MAGAERRTFGTWIRENAINLVVTIFMIGVAWGSTQMMQTYKAEKDAARDRQLEAQAQDQKELQAHIENNKMKIQALDILQSQQAARIAVIETDNKNTQLVSASMNTQLAILNTQLKTLNDSLNKLSDKVDNLKAPR